MIPKINTGLLFLSIFLPLFLPSMVLAQAKIQSDNYIIQMPGLNSGAGIPSSSNYKLDSSIGQTAAGLFSSSGYKVRSGFQYIHSIIPFSFTISDFTVELGSLTVDTPTTQTTTLTVSAGGAGGYTVSAFENNPLQTTASAQIPDTICDGGTCTESTAAVWSSSTVYGFGFNMTGDDIPADFTNSTYFRQFADASSAETAKTIMSSANVGKSRQSTVTFRVNVSATQEAGSYQNIVTMTATPGF